MVDRAGCGTHKDTLDCLRKIPYATYKKATDASPSMFSYHVGAYLALMIVFTISARLGRVVNVPTITGVLPFLHLRWGSTSFQETVTMRALCSRSPHRMSRKYKLCL